jgi:phage/plasmid-like protein (TIGR03299 family)
MSANIQSLMYVKEKPWHGLGTRLEKAATAEEAIKAAGLDWEVSKEPIFLNNGSAPIPKHHSIVRKDRNTPLGIVGDRYVPLQNRSAFSFFDAVVGVKEAIYDTAGALGQGEIIWILAKLNGIIRVVGDDVSEKFLLLTNRHDGTGTVKVLRTPIRVVCQNTLNMALSGEGEELHTSLRHTASLGLKVDEVRQALGIINAKFDLFESAAKRLAHEQVTPTAWKTYLENLGLAPKKEEDGTSHATKVMEEVSALFDKGRGNNLPGVKGTWWAGFNAVAEYVDYYRNPKGLQENRAKSLLFGSGAVLKQRAWKEALSLVK